MLRMLKWSAIELLTIGCSAIGCSAWKFNPSGPSYSYEEYGTGGALPLTLPFPSGEYWVLTQGYGSNDADYRGSHRNYGFLYGDDTYALDFSQSGCNAYGKPVTPIADGFVLEVGLEGSDGDHGYGNNVLVNHGDEFVSHYAHLSQVLVSEGDWLETEDSLGLVGNSGYTIGTACDEHPGTHLHLAYFLNEEGQEPMPLSGLTGVQLWCWYNREGNQSCSGDPGSYEPVEEAEEFEDEVDESEDDADEEDTEEDEDEEEDEESYELNVELLPISPEHGTADETEFIWSAVVESSEKPEATLYIKNPNDGVSYDFEMETEQDESPYVFTYQKTLNDPESTYTYWVKVSDGDDDEISDTESVYTEEGDGDGPVFGIFSISPSSGEEDETVFTWGATVHSDEQPDMWLKIVNAADAEIYSFEMDVEWNGEAWYGEYEKTLRDPTVYTYWMEAENWSGTNTGLILDVEVE